MDYRNNGNGSWTWFCEDCGKEEIVFNGNSPKKIKSFSGWCESILPKLNLDWYIRPRVWEWMLHWGGMGLCKRCATRKIDYCTNHPSPEERELA